MKIFILFILAFWVLPFTLGASIIDKDTKKMVEELNYKLEKVLQYQHANQEEVLKAVAQQTEALENLTGRVESLEKQQQRFNALKQTPVVPEKPAMVTVVSPEPVAAAPTVVPENPVVEAKSPEPIPAPPTTTLPSMVNLETTPAPVVIGTPVVAAQEIIPEPVPPPTPTIIEAQQPPVVTPPISKKSEIKQTSLIPPLFIKGAVAYLIAGLSAVLMIVLFVRMKRSEQKIKTMLWRADMEALREDLARERKMNPKIHITGEPAKVHLP